ncbi:MAG: hypothetical protein U0704_13300 [Candidatus Eisenbacteria bacterium]
MYFYGLIVATSLIVMTVGLAIGINRVREWREERERIRRAR